MKQKEMRKDASNKDNKENLKKKNRSVLLSTDKREAEQQTRKAGRGEGHLLPELGVSAPHPPTPPPPPHHPPPPGSAVLAAGGRGGTAVKAARRSRSRSLPPPRTRPSLRSIPALRALRSDLASPYPAAWPAPSQVGLLVTLLLFIYIYIYIYGGFGIIGCFFFPFACAVLDALFPTAQHTPPGARQWVLLGF